MVEIWGKIQQKGDKEDVIIYPVSPMQGNIEAVQEENVNYVLKATEYESYTFLIVADGVKQINITLNEGYSYFVPQKLLIVNSSSTSIDIILKIPSQIGGRSVQVISNWKASAGVSLEPYYCVSFDYKIVPAFGDYVIMTKTDDYVINNE